MSTTKKNQMIETIITKKGGSSMKGIKITVESIKGHCGAGMQPGDTFVIEGHKDNLVMGNFKGFCPELLAAILPPCFIMAYEGSLPWEEEGAVISSCPDPNNLLKVKIERIPKVE